MTNQENKMFGMVRALNRVNEDKGITLSGKVFMSILFMMFVVVLLMALFMNVSSFKAVYESRQDTNYERGTLALITSTVRANDRQGGVAQGEGPEGKSLVLVEHGDDRDYETRIYLYQGNIVEEYSVSTDSYTPDKASVMAASSTFDFSYEGTLLTIETDQGSAQIKLRCSKEADQS